MDKLKLPYFGEVNLEDDFSETEFTDSTGQEILISIDFEGEEPAKEAFDTIRVFLEHLEENMQKIKGSILSSEFSEAVNDYIEHHLKELKEEPEIQEINSPKEFVEALKFVNINICPTAEERFFSFDLTIGEELTNDLLVVDLLEDLTISYITTES